MRNDYDLGLEITAKILSKINVGELKIKAALHQSHLLA